MESVEEEFIRKRNPKDFVNSLTGEKQILWTIDELLELLLQCTNLQHRAYLSFVYLSGCRAIEPLPHFQRNKVMAMVTIAGKRVREWTGEFKLHKVDGFKVGDIIGVNRFSKEANRMVRFIDFRNLYVAKTRRSPVDSRRVVPVNAEQYRPFLEFIYDYINSEDLEKDSVLFKFSVRNAEYFCDKVLGVMPHYLRHLRLTHLKLVHGFDSIDLMKFVGWSSVKPTEVYMRMDATQLALKQV